MTHLNPLVFGALGLILLGVLKALPLLLAVLNPRRIRCWFADSQAKEDLISRSEALRARLQELAALGFTVLGVKHEKMPLWGRSASELATTSTANHTFASIVLTERGEPFTVYFLTPFLEHGFVYTRQQLSLPQLESNDTSVKNISSQNLGELFSSHGERVEAFRQQGLYPLAAASQESRVEATYRFYASWYARKILVSSALFACLPSLFFALLLLYANRQF